MSYRKNVGFTLIELMIVIAIVGILASVAVPSYRTYVKRAQFGEVVLATTAYRTPAIVAVQTGRATTVDDLDAGTFGIPDNLATSESVSTYVESVDMTDGVITAIGTSAVDNGVLRIEGSISAGGLRWNVDDTIPNSCQSLGIC